MTGYLRIFLHIKMNFKSNPARGVVLASSGDLVKGGGAGFNATLCLLMLLSLSFPPPWKS